MEIDIPSGTKSSPTFSFPAFKLSASLIQSTLRGSKAFWQSEVDARAQGVVDNQSLVGALFSNVWANEVLDRPKVGCASPNEGTVNYDIDFSNGPEEVGVQEEDDEAELPPLDLKFVLQCACSSTDKVSNSHSAKVKELEEEPPTSSCREAAGQQARVQVY